MRGFRVGVGAFVLASCMALVSYADTLTLKTGNNVEGVIVERENEYVILRTSDTEKLYTANEIESINGEKFVFMKPKKKAAAPAQQTKLPEQVVALQKVMLPQTVAPGARPAAQQWMESMSPNFLLSLAAGILAYAVCVMFLLMRIAEKTRVGDPWHAWIPIANLFLLCRVAGLGYIWVLGFFVAFIPKIGPLLNILALGYIWWHVAQARKYSGWVGLLVLLVPLNVIPMAVLAFRDRPEAQSEKKVFESPQGPVPGPTGVEAPRQQ